MEYVTLIPNSRVSSGSKIDIRIYTDVAVKAIIRLNKNDLSVNKYEFKLNPKKINIFYIDTNEICGKINIVIDFKSSGGNTIKSVSKAYEITNKSTKSTTLIDGCWVSIYHWSEDEGRCFNEDLKKLTDDDWKKQIYAMNDAGIKGVIIQNVFQNNEYAGLHNMKCKSYPGKAFYPSDLYKSRVAIAAHNPIEAILAAADECGMNVFLGVGMYAWFDFSSESLKWHKIVTNELWRKYGHHKSLYGWYISEEIFGSLYYDYPPVRNGRYKDIIKFFKEYKKYVSKLSPTKPVALAPNNIRFDHYAIEWKLILKNIDILLPFAFARDPEHMNIDRIAQICQPSGTHFWVDMEMFAWPLDNGLVPKTYENLIKEIRTYDMLEQIYGYQFTGIMNTPDSSYDLGGEKAKDLYVKYKSYYENIMKNNI